MNPQHSIPTPSAMNTIRMIDPKKIRYHEALKRLPALDADDASIRKVEHSIRDLGRITDPLKLTEQGLLVDGRRRHAAALRIGMPEVPCVYVPELEVPALIVAQLEARSHFTKSQRAYLMSPLLQEAFDYARQRMLTGGLDNPRNSVPRVAKRVEDWAEEMGMTDRVLRQAQELRKFFEDETPRTITDDEGHTEEGVSFREFFEPRILRENDPYGLGAALTGIKQHILIEKKRAAGIEHGGGKPVTPQRQFALFSRAWTDLRNRFEYWDKFPLDLKREASTAVGTAITAMPGDLLLFTKKQCEAELRSRKSL